MSKKKIIKKVKKVSSHKTKVKAKKTKKVVKKISHKTKPVPKTKKVATPKVSSKLKEMDVKADKLIAKGRERGFITYDEIMKEFPKLEDNIIFLDSLYNKFVVAGVDVLEGGGMLETDEEQLKNMLLMEHVAQMLDTILYKYI